MKHGGGSGDHCDALFCQKSSMAALKKNSGFVLFKLVVRSGEQDML